MSAILRPPNGGASPPRERGISRVRRFLVEQTFSPEFFPASLRHPIYGYLIALFVQVIMVLLMLWLTKSFPIFHFFEAPLICAVLVVALGWGVGPSVVATLFGALLLALLVLPPYFSLKIAREDVIGITLYIIIGLTVSVVASQTQRARRIASERASQLEAILEGITDGVFIIGVNKSAQQINPAARELLNLSDDVRTGQLFENGRPFDLYDEQDNLIPYEQWPQAHILAGEVLRGANAEDVVMRTYDARKLYLNVTGAPIHAANGQISGAILVCRDVTERRALERRTQEALQALLVMAGEVVQLPGSSGRGLQSAKELPFVAKRLAELIRQVLSCQRVSLTAEDPQTQIRRSLAVVGLSAQQEQFWLERRAGMNLQELLPGTAIEAGLQNNEIRVADFTQPPLQGRVNPFGSEAVVLAPMKVGTQRIGVLAIDYGGIQHTYTGDELALIQAIADLAALVLERERLLTERADAQANTLAAQEANRLMEEFIGIAGHELRTPLTTIKAGVQLAKRQVERLQRQEETLPANASKMMSNVSDLLERTERQIGMQNRLISDLLDVSRIQTGRLELHPELHDMIVLARQVVEDQRYLTSERTITFESASTNELLVMADADRLRQVITNYLSNALKYSAADTPVAVYVEPRETQVRVAVRDEGPGLSESQLQQVWQRFYRVPGIEVKSGTGVGLGLGLHISRMIVERQGGKVGVESIPDVGSTFWFTLPLAEK